jgi:hypothetical protein
MLPTAPVRPVLWSLLVVLLAGLLLLLLLMLLEPALIYHPTPAGGATPAQWGLPYRAVAIPTADGQTLQAWWLPREEPEAPLLLFFHGNAGNREDRLHNLAGLWRAGIAVLIFDYRGYGGSSGRPSERGLLLDGEAAFDWLRGETGGRPIFFFGRSLGGAVAARVALRRPAAGLILESTFTSVPAMARVAFPLPGIQRLVRTRLDALGAVKTLRVPLLIIHGTADELVPIAMGRRLYEAAPGPDKTFRAVPGGRHNDTYVLAGAAYTGWLRRFMSDPNRPQSTWKGP